jgi:hypothetical protein
MNPIEGKKIYRREESGFICQVAKGSWVERESGLEKIEM